MRQLATRRLPPQIAKKKKWGFGLPLDTWVSPTMRDYMHDTLLGPSSQVLGFLNREVIASWIAVFNGEIDLRGQISRIGL